MYSMAWAGTHAAGENKAPIGCRQILGRHELVGQRHVAARSPTPEWRKAMTPPSGGYFSQISPPTVPICKEFSK